MTKTPTKLNIRRVLWYYWQQMRQHKWQFFAILFFYTIGIALVEIVTPLILRDVIDSMSAGVPSTTVGHHLWMLFWLFVGLTIFQEIVFRIADFTLVSLEAHVLRLLLHDVLDRLSLHSANFFSEHFSGALIAQSKRFVRNFTDLLEGFVFHIWWSGFKVPAIIITLFFVAPKVALLFTAWVIVYVIVVSVMVRRGIPYDLAEAGADSHVTARFSDVITNVLTVKMFARHDFERASFAEVTLDQATKQRRAWNYEITQILVQGVLFGLLGICSLYFSISLWLAGTLSTGTVVLIQLYIAKFFASLWPLGRVIKRFIKMIADGEEIVDIFDQAVDVANPAAPEKCVMTRGEIVFDDVSFAYNDGAEHVVTHLSLTISAGQKVGLVGTSGAGKTTITKLLLRFADVSAGRVVIDGQDVRAVTQDDLRGRIAYVPQEPLLFHRSLKENIAYARPDATDAEITHAAQMAHAHDFISALPQGYETLVGERGVKLSGGERQRVAIARAILKDAPVLVFDEATSALDSVSEQHIQSAMGELMTGRTAIVIAHRLSTLTQMDRIIVMENGQIVEDGTHAELLAAKGRYARFWAQQAGGFVA